MRSKAVDSVDSVVSAITVAKVRERMERGARNYALADRSDPFAYSRAMSHIDLGICTDGATYEATPTQEMRKLPDGNALSNGEAEYAVTVYRDVRRP